MTRPLAFVLLLGAAFLAGLVWMFDAQFSSGEAYPDYSTMRTDPSGARALYDSLAATGGFDVTRNFQPLEYAGISGATIVLLGMQPPFTIETAENLEKLAARGNRVVVALRLDEDKLPAGGVLEKRWHVKLPSGDEIVERPFGGGSLVIVPEGGVFHNGSLAEGPASELILRALGPARRIVFDESHLGMVESGSLVGLARRYRLQGFAWGCAVVLVLFLWRNTSPFPPVAPATPDAAPDAATIAGRTSASGLAGLLRQNVDRQRLVQTAWDLWTVGNPRGVAPSRRARAEALARTPGDPLATLAEIHRTLESKGPNDTRATQNRA
jgi:hypothetical protein